MGRRGRRARSWRHLDPLRELAFRVADPELATLLVKGPVLLTQQGQALREAAAEKPDQVPYIEGIIRDTANALTRGIDAVPDPLHRAEMTRRIDRHLRSVGIEPLELLRGTG